MLGQKMDVKANKKIEEDWDKMADMYEEIAETFTYQGSITCALMAGMNKT